MACKILAGNYSINSKNCRECVYFLNSSEWKDKLAPFAANKTHPFCPFSGFANILTLYKTNGRILENSRGTLSLKSVCNGTEQYEIDGEKLLLRNQSYLIVNENSRYVSSIDKGSIADTFCLSFGKDYIKEVAASFTPSIDNALTDGKDEEFITDLPDFLPIVCHSDNFINSGIQILKRNVTKDTPEEWFEEICLSIFRHLVEVHQKIRIKIDNISAAKKNTRIEIFKRLNAAKNFAEENFNQDITLEAMAQSAYLSKFRFLRYFKETFGITPHQFINLYRLKKAKNLILTSKKSITDISLDVGFKSPNHFTRLFTRQYGFSPKNLRR